MAAGNALRKGDQERYCSSSPQLAELAVARSVLLISFEAGGALFIFPRSSTEIIGIFVEELFLFNLELFLATLAFSTMLIPSDFPEYGSTQAHTVFLQ
jgi:hypothetical protein